jgi:hypothetical protein
MHGLSDDKPVDEPRSCHIDRLSWNKIQLGAKIFAY